MEMRSSKKYMCQKAQVGLEYISGIKTWVSLIDYQF